MKIKLSLTQAVEKSSKSYKIVSKLQDIMKISLGKKEIIKNK